MKLPLPTSSVIAALDKVAREAVLPPAICTAAASASRCLRLGDDGSGRFDPEMVTCGVELAGYYVERGITKFGDVAETMLADMTSGGVPEEKVRPYLAVWYGGARGLISLADDLSSNSLR